MIFPEKHITFSGSKGQHYTRKHIQTAMMGNIIPVRGSYELQSSL